MTGFKVSKYSVIPELTAHGCLIELGKHTETGGAFKHQVQNEIIDSYPHFV